ncbi:MAG: TIGR01459 family HAD-type hydrolase [Paracoccus sp. (in: a-proteobacteria)]|uniref:TIGR01459 family HAD-type hydrolase n=1 Tax=Paracoccus sp. TaxID=267 RepID=UPI0026E10E85|nr:TIGR01459 family HAD-type hydrolase [Paracoccus sp. (in: a-proteobacteria)]MDO5630506.1 TIGR01459 family HAD-type hydrolase [Paracoccus sp. (in: a-proteobacteria)]
MTRIIDSLSQIGGDYSALLCDLWGCLHNGKQPYPAAVAALQAFRADGGQVCLLTNSPRPFGAVQAQLDGMGVPRDAWDVIVSSGDATQAAMMAGQVGHKVWHIGAAKDDVFFSDLPAAFADAPPVARVPLDQAQGIICTGPFDEATEAPEDYRDRFVDAIARGLPMLCANPDIVVDMGETRIYCAGALAALYQEMGGQAFYFGKPHTPVYDMARARLALGVDARVLAVGDGIFTDVLGAAQQGIDALFVTGGLAADLMGSDVENPDPGLLAEWLAEQGQAPHYAIGRLR